jgi:hypothetical protein
MTILDPTAVLASTVANQRRRERMFIPKLEAPHLLGSVDDG